MSHHAFSRIRIVTAALLLAAAPVTNAVIYTWLNEDDTTTYSDQPPGDAAEVRELTRIEPPPALPAEMPRNESIEAQREKSSTGNAVVKGGDTPARAAVRSNVPLAVQDPCLTSSDRYCYQKQSGNYRPYIGYSPGAPAAAETPQAAGLSATGATAGEAGSGAVAGGSAAPQSVLPPPRRSKSSSSAAKP
jgi:hypothetical protein